MPSLKSSQIQIIQLFTIFISFYPLLKRFIDRFYHSLINFNRLKKR